MTPTRRSQTNPTRVLGWVLALGLAATLVGCGPTEVETTYGWSRGKSINGTNAFFGMIRERGHKVRAAKRYNETLAAWADTIVRFAPAPGPPGITEAKWLDTWLRANSGRKLVYVAHDSDAGPEFWARMLAALPKTGVDNARGQILARAKTSDQWLSKLPARAKPAAKVAEWFGTAPVDPKKPDEVTTWQTLEGPWAAGIDPRAAALPKHEAIVIENDETVQLSGDGANFAISWRSSVDPDKRGGTLVLANGSFLINAGLLNKARRPLASHVLDWIGDGPTHVAFVEGDHPLQDEDEPEISPFHLLTVTPFNWIAAHLGAFGLLLVLSLAATIGRPRPEPVGAIERPSAHPIALGSIFARTRRAADALDLLTTYRRWRQPAGASNRAGPDPAPSSPRRAPRA